MCYRCVTDSLTHSLTTLKDSATQLLIKYKSGALVTQSCYVCIWSKLNMCRRFEAGWFKETVENTNISLGKYNNAPYKGETFLNDPKKRWIGLQPSLHVLDQFPIYSSMCQTHHRLHLVISIFKKSSRDSVFCFINSTMVSKHITNLFRERCHKLSLIWLEILNKTQQWVTLSAGCWFGQCPKEICPFLMGTSLG